MSDNIANVTPPEGDKETVESGNKTRSEAFASLLCATRYNLTNNNPSGYMPRGTGLIAIRRRARSVYTPANWSNN